MNTRIDQAHLAYFVAAGAAVERAPAANDDAAHGAAQDAAQPSAGWDPYEVWASRVRDARSVSDAPARRR